jgi:hypothetical protein
MEQELIRKITGKTHGIRTGSLTPEDAGVGRLLNLLKPINEGMYEELLNRYRQAVKNTL